MTNYSKNSLQFIEKYYPKYDGSTLVAETLDLMKIVDGEMQEGDDSWKKYEEVMAEIKELFNGTLTDGELNDQTIITINNELSKNLAELMEASVEHFFLTNPDYQKQVAVVTAYIMAELIATTSFFDSVDKVYQKAVEFIDLYPPGTVWGKDGGLNYEEAICAFANK